MTYRELAAQIGSLTERQQNQLVVCCQASQGKEQAFHSFRRVLVFKVADTEDVWQPVEGLRVVVGQPFLIT